MNQLDLKGQNALVTGGAQGIGHAIVLRLIQSGANVCIWGRNQSKMDQAVSEFSKLTSGNQIVANGNCDISDKDSIEAAFKNYREQFGNVDILVNNAGFSGPNAPTWEYPIDEWLKTVDINLTGTFLVCRTVIPSMLENKDSYGRIVNISSIAGKEGNPNAPAYSSTKAAIIGLTKSLGKELANTRITVNCVTPAVIRTPLLEQMSEAHVDYMLSKIPMSRFGEPEEAAALVAWLCSPDCSFTTAGVFDLSGGRATY